VSGDPRSVEIVQAPQEPAPPIEGSSAPLTLLGTPAASTRHTLERFRDQADVFLELVREKRLAVNIGGRDFLLHTAWTYLGAMLGVSPVVVWTRRLEDGTGWEARVEARTFDGRVVGAAEAMCNRGEKTWRDRSEHALRAMAQTRAISRALRMPLSFVAVLAGFDVTADPDDEPVSRGQVQVLAILARELDWDDDERHRRAGVDSFKDLTRGQAAQLIEEWQGLTAGGDQPGDSAGINVVEEPEQISLEEARERAVAHFGSKAYVCKAYLQTYEPDNGVIYNQLTAEEFLELIQRDERSPGIARPEERS